MSRSVPEVLAIEVTNKCNAQCAFCPLFHGPDAVDRRKRPSTTMSYELFVAIIDQIKTWNELPRVIYLNMFGEPLLDNGIEYKIEYLAKSGMASHVAFQTNGEFLSEQMSQLLCEHDIGYFLPNFESHRPDVYEALRKGCHYHVVMNNIINFVTIRNTMKSKTRIGIKSVITTHNMLDLVEVFTLFKPHMRHNDSLHAGVASSWASQYLKKQESLPGRSGESMFHADCTMLRDMLVILADGLIPACCYDYNLEVFEGPQSSFYSAPLLDIFRERAASYLLTRIHKGIPSLLPDICQKCSALFAEPFQIPIPAKLANNRIKSTQNGLIIYY